MLYIIVTNVTFDWDRVLKYGILDLVTSPNEGTKAVLGSSMDHLVSLIPEVKIDKTFVVQVKKNCQR